MDHIVTPRLSASLRRSFAPSRMSVSADAAGRRISRSSSTSSSEFSADDLTGLLEEVEAHPSACGGYSDVYKYRICNQKQPMYVAVKSLRFYDGFEIIVEETLQKMRREIRAWIGLDHPNILKLLGIFNRPGLPLPCLVSPWMKNKTATSYLRKEPGVKLIPFILGIANGLSHLHSNNIAHGDIRGDNIFVTDDGQACIGDFGLSKLVDGFDVTTGTSDWGGPSRWTAMEYLDYGEEENNSSVPRSPTKSGDVWSFGMSCLELWSGQAPYFNVRKEQVPFMISRGKLPKFPEAKRLDFRGEKERIRTICILSWVKEPNHRPGIDVLRSVIQAYIENDDGCTVESEPLSPTSSGTNGSASPISPPVSPSPTVRPRSNHLHTPTATISPSLSATGSDASYDLVESMPELKVDAEGASSGEDNPTQGLIPLFAAPPPLPPTAESMLNDRSTSHKTSLITYFSRKGKFNSLKFARDRSNSKHPFTIRCMAEGVEIGCGVGAKAKDAEENAAREALIRLYDEDSEGIEGVLQYYPRFEIHLANHNLFRRVKWVIDDDGLAHLPVWTCKFMVDNTLFAQGIGPDKRLAKEHAARKAAALWIDAMQ